MSNEQIAKLLRNIAVAYTIKNEKKFRFQIIAYQRAADFIKNSSIELKDYYKDSRLQDIPGIGTSIKGHLEELFKIGKSKQFNWALKGIPEPVFVLIDIPTFGPKKSYRLVNEFGLSNSKNVIADLEKIAKKGIIAKLKGFGEKSQRDILRAIKEFKEGKGKTSRMVLPFASEISDKIIDYLHKSPHVGRTYVLGSLRRMVPTIGDIDIAVASNDPKKVIDHFISYPYIERMIEKGKETASMLVSGGKQVDLMVQPPQAFGSLLQHFTGSKNHNIALREFALKKNMSLSEHGIKYLKSKKSTIQQIDSEEKFYKTIGLAWIPPEIRENTGEIELAAKKALPKLIEIKDMKGDFHIHSSFPIEPSHDLGKNTIGEMANKAISLGYEYVGFSEHSPSTSKHTDSQIYTLISRRNQEIEQIKLRNKSIRILKLLEIDILPSGKLAVDTKSLNLLDFAIVSIHSVFSMDKKTMTERVIKGLSHPKAKILAHPTGRILNERQGYKLDWNKILNFCKQKNKALEINAWPSRLDLSDQLIRQCVNNDVKMAINTDSHALDQMENMKYGIAMARRGWATKNDILNTLEYNEFINWVRR